MSQIPEQSPGFPAFQGAVIDRISGTGTGPAGYFVILYRPGTGPAEKK